MNMMEGKDDTISRQAAIKALDSRFKQHLLENRFESFEEADSETKQFCDGIMESIGTVMDLPATKPEIIRCKDCIYYDPPHIENNGERYEYKDMPKEAFDIFGIGVNCEYGINVGGRCERDYNAAYDEDKRVFVPESNFCGRARRRTNGSD